MIICWIILAFVAYRLLYPYFTNARNISGGYYGGADEKYCRDTLDKLNNEIKEYNNLLSQEKNMMGNRPSIKDGVELYNTWEKNNNRIKQELKNKKEKISYYQGEFACGSCKKYGLVQPKIPNGILVDNYNYGDDDDFGDFGNSPLPPTRDFKIGFNSNQSTGGYYSPTDVLF